MLFANTVLSNFNYQKWNCRRGMFNWLKLKMILVRESQSKYRGIKVPCRQFMFFFSKFFKQVIFSQCSIMFSQTWHFKSKSPS